MGGTTVLDEGGLMILLTLRDLQHRALRFVVVILLAAVVFSLLFVMTGLVEQFQQEPFLTTDAFGASGWVVADGTSGPFTSGSALPAAAAANVDADTVAPAVVARSSIRREGVMEAVMLVGHGVGQLGSPATVEGRAATAPGEVVLDSALEAEVGDRIEVVGRSYEVVGISDDTTVLAGLPLAFMVLADAQQLAFQTEAVVSLVLVDGDVRSTPPGTTVMTSDAVAQDALGPLEGAVASIDLVRVLLWFVAAVLIGAVVYLSALDRIRDFAVLKAIGASNGGLMAGLAIQAILVALCAVAVASVVQLFLAPMFPLKVTVPTRAFLQIPLFSVVLALVGGAAGMRKVAASDPALAFAGAGG
jgi:putative ABC transport system permease protein